jgi:hypothetical protein
MAGSQCSLWSVFNLMEQAIGIGAVEPFRLPQARRKQTTALAVVRYLQAPAEAT